MVAPVCQTAPDWSLAVWCSLVTSLVQSGVAVWCSLVQSGRLLGPVAVWYTSSTTCMVFRTVVVYRISTGVILSNMSVFDAKIETRRYVNYDQTADCSLVQSGPDWKRSSVMTQQSGQN